MQQRQGISDIADFQFCRNIRVGHGTCADHAFFSFALQGTFKQLQGVFFYLYVFKIMIHAVAGAARVAINTAVRTASVKIHAIFCG